MAVGGHAVIKIYGKTELTPEKLVNGAVNYAKLNKKDQYKDKAFYAAIIEESHVIAHKFKDYWILDVYTCGNKKQMKNTIDFLISKFEINEIFGFYTPRGGDFDEKDFNLNLKFKDQLNPGYDHILLDLSVDGSKIETVDSIVNYVRKVVDEDVIARYQFTPYGASGIMRNGRKMVTFHSWPEYGLLTIDFIGFRSELPKVRQFVEEIEGDIIKEWDLAYGKTKFSY